MSPELARKILLVLFLPSSVWESIVTGFLFFYPEFEGKQFNTPVTPETIFSSNLLGGFMILFSALCWLCTYELWKRDPHGKRLAVLIGVFWCYMGVGLYLHPGAPAYMLGDTVRGAVILGLALMLPKSARSDTLAA